MSKENKIKVFLGGTCNESTWRERLIEQLNIDYFNPIVDDWTEECMAEELRQRENCDYLLYVITPLMTGVYSIAEAVDDSNKRPDKTLFCFIERDRNNSGYWEGFTKAQIKSLGAVSKMIKRNGAQAFDSLKQISIYLNSSKPKENNQTRNERK